MRLFSRKNKFEGLNYLELTPVRRYEHVEKDTGLIDVLVPRFNDKILGKYLQPRLKNKYIKANLDDIGTLTWQLIDGTSQVYQIADSLSTEFGERVHPSNDRLIAFLNQLYRNDFIYFKEIRKD